MSCRALLVIAVTAAIATSFTPAVASTAELQRAVQKAIVTQGLEKNKYSIEDRRRLAESFLNYWVSFYDRLPRLSPMENEWISRELSSNVSERINYVTSRREFSIWVLLDKSSSCKNLYSDLLKDIGKNSKLEALRWARSISCYKDDESLMNYLVLAGLVTDARRDGSFKTQLFSLWIDAVLGGVLGSVLDEPYFR
jgi:hypothetical protein